MCIRDSVTADERGVAEGRHRRGARCARPQRDGNQQSEAKNLEAPQARANVHSKRFRRPVNELSSLLGLRGRLRIDTIDSPALRGNALGDPSSRPLAVYTPPGYDAEGSRRYPVLYCLHGYTGDVAALVSARAWETNVVQWIDRLVVSEAMPPALLVVVDGFTRLGGSQYVDSVQMCIRDRHDTVPGAERHQEAQGARTPVALPRRARDVASFPRHHHHVCAAGSV